MSVRIWGKVMPTAVGAGVLIGAGQLGVAYGLGIVRLDRSFEAGAGNQWNTQLAWVSWFAMLAAVAGAAAAERVARRHQDAPGVGTRILVALFGGVGAGAVVPLSVQPARSAELAQSVDPALVVGLAAGLGAVAGVLVAVAALSLRPLAWNLATVAAAVWLVGLASVVPYLGPDDQLPTIRLGVPQWTVQAGETDRLVEMLGMPVLALLAGLVVAAVARGRRESGLAAAVSGVAGAAPLALAYLIAGPGPDADTADQMAPYLGTLIAVPAGLLGSLLISLTVRRDRDKATAKAGGRTRSADTVEPTNIIPPLTEGSPQRRVAPTQWPPTPDPSAAPTMSRPAPGPSAAPTMSRPAPGPSAAPTMSRPAPTMSRPSPAAGVASVPRPDAHVDWVSGLSSQPPPGGQRGGKLPRRVPGDRFPAGT
jgi:hypothetical protein